MINHKNHPDEWCYNSQSGNLLSTYVELQEADLLFLKEMLLPNEECSKEWLCKIETDYLFCGHTHNPFIYHYNGKNLVNCSSVGVPINGQTKTQFTQIEFINGEWEINLVSLPYDIDKMLEDFKASIIFAEEFQCKNTP